MPPSRIDHDGYAHGYRILWILMGFAHAGGLRAAGRRRLFKIINHFYQASV